MWEKAVLSTTPKKLFCEVARRKLFVAVRVR